MTVQNKDAERRLGSEPSSPAGKEHRDPCNELAVALGHAVLALGRAGYPDEASRIAAAGYIGVRVAHPAAAKRLNGVMHSLARMPEVPTATNEQSPDV